MRKYYVYDVFFIVENRIGFIGIFYVVLSSVGKFFRVVLVMKVT